MDERAAVTWAEFALRDGFGFDECAKLLVGGVCCDCFVVAEELPLRKIVQVEFGFEPGEVRQCGTLQQHAAGDELRTGFLNAD